MLLHSHAHASTTRNTPSGIESGGSAPKASSRLSAPNYPPGAPLGRRWRHHLPGYALSSISHTLAARPAALGQTLVATGAPAGPLAVTDAATARQAMDPRAADPQTPPKAALNKQGKASLKAIGPTRPNKAPCTASTQLVIHSLPD